MPSRPTRNARWSPGVREAVGAAQAHPAVLEEVPLLPGEDLVGEVGLGGQGPALAERRAPARAAGARVDRAAARTWRRTSSACRTVGIELARPGAGSRSGGLNGRSGTDRMVAPRSGAPRTSRLDHRSRRRRYWNAGSSYTRSPPTQGELHGRAARSPPPGGRTGRGPARRGRRACPTSIEPVRSSRWFTNARAHGERRRSRSPGRSAPRGGRPRGSPRRYG